MQEPWEVEKHPDTPRQAHYSHGSPLPLDQTGDAISFQALGVLAQYGRDSEMVEARGVETSRSVPSSSVPASKDDQLKVEPSLEATGKSYAGPASEHGSWHAEDGEDGSEWCSDHEKLGTGKKEWLEPEKDVGCCRDGTYVGACGEA